MRAGVLSHTGHISVSGRVADRVAMATGLAHELTTETFVEIGLGEASQGPCAEIPLCDLHLALYHDRGDVNSVLHTHSPFATAFALAHASLPVHYEPLLRYEQTVAVPVAPWAPRGSPAFSIGVRATLQQNPKTRAVLLANHGLLVMASTPALAAKLLITVEEAAAAEIRSAGLGGTRPMESKGPG